MVKRGHVSYILVIILVLIAPTLISLGYYVVTRNPALRPLAVTQASLSSYEAGLGLGGHVVARIEWVEEDNMGFSRRQIERLVTRAFEAKGIEVDVLVVPGVEETSITYLVGASRMGPYPVIHAAAGVSAAAAAFHMAENQR